MLTDKFECEIEFHGGRTHWGLFDNKDEAVNFLIGFFVAMPPTLRHLAQGFIHNQSNSYNFVISMNANGDATAQLCKSSFLKEKHIWWQEGF